MKKTLLLTLILWLSFSLAISGCTTTRKPAPKPAPPAKMTPTPKTPTPTPAPARKPATPAHTQATKLANAAEKVGGKSATVVITGSTAMVGLEKKSGIEAKPRISKLKWLMKSKEPTPVLKTVSITTDPNLITRLKK